MEDYSMDETLRFRAWISIPLRDGRERGFYLYDVDLYRHGGIYRIQ